MCFEILHAYKGCSCHYFQYKLCDETAEISVLGDVSRREFFESCLERGGRRDEHEGRCGRVYCGGFVWEDRNGGSGEGEREWDGEV
jgi:hypothetical protein